MKPTADTPKDFERFCVVEPQSNKFIECWNQPDGKGPGQDFPVHVKKALARHTYNDNDPNRIETRAVWNDPEKPGSPLNPIGNHGFGDHDFSPEAQNAFKDQTGIDASKFPDKAKVNRRAPARQQMCYDQYGAEILKCHRSGCGDILAYANLVCWGCYQNAQEFYKGCLEGSW